MEKEICSVITWIKKYVKDSGAKGVVVGNSGGKDCAVVIALCVKALGKNNVLTVTIPCLSSSTNISDAILISNTFGVNLLHVNLTSIYNNFTLILEKSLNSNLVSNSKINIMPRLRMTTLYAIAQQYNYLVAGTGNLCEQFIGYTTKWGDNSSDFNPIAEFNVHEVLEIGKILGVPEKILTKKPNDDLGLGTDEEKLGITYDEIENFIKYGKIKNQVSMEKIIKLHKQTEHKRNIIPIYHRNL